jgi:hypothetical protein
MASFIRDDMVAATLVNATPEQITNWVESNVTSLEAAKDVIAVILKLLRGIIKRIDD